MWNMVARLFATIPPDAITWEVGFVSAYLLYVPYMKTQLCDGHLSAKSCRHISVVD